MKDPDRTIENLLVGLRDAEPPPGMYHRILDAMAARQATTYRSHRLLRLAAAISLACVLAITIRVSQHRHIPTNLRSDTKHVDAPPTKLPRTVANITPRESKRSASRVSLRSTTQVRGFPAPPLPLTEQEKLLLRLAHRNDARDMNLLNPDVQAQESAQAIQQFQQFFGMDNDQMRSESE
jgi:hypothetical protein